MSHTRNLHPRISAKSEAEATVWVARRDAGLTAAEEHELARWLAADESHAPLLARFDSAWTALDRPRERGAADEILLGLKRRDRRRRQTRLMLASAAALVLAFAVGLGVRSRSAGPPPVAVAAIVPVGQRLPDGSFVEFRHGAEIALDFSPAVRRVRLLKGEAHFQVAHDTARPFVVMAGEVAVRAVGTAFAVHFDPQVVEVVVTEGRVSVDDSVRGTIASEDAPITAGNRVVVPVRHPETPVKLTGLTRDELGERLAWRDTRLEFTGTALSEAMARFNARNRVQLVAGDPLVGRYKVSGIFRSDNLDAFVRLLEGSFGVRVEHRSSDEIILRRAR